MTSEPFRFRVGALSCVVITDGGGVLTEAEVASIFADDTDRVLAVFRALPEPPVMSVNILVVESAGQRFMIDTGIGHLDPSEPGQLLDGLRTANITPESIDQIILTHYHRDHIGGLVDQNGQPHFPNAQVIAPAPEHAHWFAEATLAKIGDERATVLRTAFAAYIEAGRLTLLDTSSPIAPGISYVAAFGHTPGHCAVQLESEGERLLHIADTAHMAMQFNLIDAVPRFDSQPEVAVATRRAIIERAAREKLLILGYHLPFPGVGHIVAAGDRYEWAAESS